MTATIQTDTLISTDHVSVIDKDIVLVLNSHWLPIAVTSPRKALVSLMGGDRDHPVCALDIEIGTDGEILNATPVDFEAWMQLPVRENDLYVQTAKQRLRCPTVVIAKNFHKSVFKRPRLTSQSIWERDNGECQYTGKKLTRKEASLDHVQPASRGGKTTFENIVLADRQVNTLKSDRTPAEAGLKLRRKPKAPPSTPVSASITRLAHPSWGPFLLRGEQDSS